MTGLALGLSIAAAVVAFLLLLFLVLALVPKLVLQRIAPGLQRRIAEQIHAPVLRQDLTANSLGLESLGATQRRGNGALVLTGEQLWFFQVLPRREFRVPLEAITEVGTAKWHLGKSYGRDLLHVVFRGEAGRRDSLAFVVADLPGWLEALRRP